VRRAPGRARRRDGRGDHVAGTATGRADGARAGDVACVGGRALRCRGARRGGATSRARARRDRSARDEASPGWEHGCRTARQRRVPERAVPRRELRHGRDAEAHARRYAHGAAPLQHELPAAPSRRQRRKSVCSDRTAHLPLRRARTLTNRHRGRGSSAVADSGGPALARAMLGSSHERRRFLHVHPRSRGHRKGRAHR
jgi:hypothetical protein